MGPNATRTLDSVPLKKIMQGIYSITIGAYNDIMHMYTLVYDTVTVTLPDLGRNISRTVTLIIDAIEAIPDCPVAATWALMNAKDQVQGYIGTVLYLKTQFEDAFFITSGELPPWLQPTKEVTTILSELVYYFKYHVEVLAWGCKSARPANPTACVLNRSVFDTETAVVDQLAGMGPVQQIFEFIDEVIVPPIELASKLYMDVTSAWDAMKRA